MTALELPEGPFTSRQGTDLGLASSTLSRMVATGELRRVFRGVYQPASLPDTLENRAKAAALVLAPFAVVCDRSAAWLHGVDALQWREHDVIPKLDCVVVRWNRRSRLPAVKGGERDLTRTDVCDIDGVRVTTPLRTALDLGCLLPAREALAVMDAFLRAGLVYREELYAELLRYRGRRGVIQCRRVVLYASGAAESAGESWTRMVILDDGLPEPTVQYWVYDGDRPLYRLDLAYPHARVAIEYDGSDFHDSVEQRRRDDDRRAWLRAHGWSVIVVRKESLADESARRAWLNEIRGALRLGS